MRQWMVDPGIMCQKHLCGCHVEHHMFLGSVKKGIKVNGYIENNLFEPSSLKSRHDNLKKEMIKRGYSHKSEITENQFIEFMQKLPSEFANHKIDRERAKEDLLSRCELCNERYKKLL